MTGRIVATAVALSLVVAGCVVPGSGGRSSDDERGRGGQRSGKGSGGALVKEGWFGLGGGFHARLEVQRVERHPDKSVLRFYVTSLEKQPDVPRFGVAGAAGINNLHFSLLDPAGRKLYRPMYDDADYTVGSQAATSVPGVRYEVVLYFPPIPDGVDTVTVISPGTAGEFAGVPVTKAAGPSGPVAPTPADTETPAPGSTKAWPLLRPTGQPKGEVQDLYDITEGPTDSTEASGSAKTIGLRTDVLFAFDSAQLSGAAKSILDGVADQVRRTADPAKPPILVEGHTDGKGGHDYNVPLSQRRAQAVQQRLQGLLGGGYRYKAEGKGETEPIAKEGGSDDEKARQRNRRVEVSFQLKKQEPGRADDGTGAGRPAEFRSDDGRTSGSRTAAFNYGADKRRIDVKPFYRDGPYLVAVFEITNLGPGGVTWLFGYSGDTSSGNFGAFGVIDPATKVLYRGVRIGPDNPNDYDDDYVDPGLANFREAPNTTNRGFFYVPAPPPGVKSVTFRAGQFGDIPNIPIR